MSHHIKHMPPSLPSIPFVIGSVHFKVVEMGVNGYQLIVQQNNCNTTAEFGKHFKQKQKKINHEDDCKCFNIALFFFKEKGNVSAKLLGTFSVPHYKGFHCDSLCTFSGT